MAETAPRSLPVPAAETVSVSSRHAVPDWPFLPVPAVEPCQTWELTGIRQLCLVRRAARQYLAESIDSDDLIGQTVLVIDELASNAVRHGRQPAQLRLCHHPDGGWLIVVTDAAPDQPPVPAVDRPAERGGMGLYVVADLSSEHGTHRNDTTKHVWAVLAQPGPT